MSKPKTPINTLPVRLPEELHLKLRLLAAYQNKSQNEIMIAALQSVVAQWEEKHGVLIIPPGLDD